MNKLNFDEDWRLPEFRSYYDYLSTNEPTCYFDDNRIFHRITSTEHPNIKVNNKKIFCSHIVKNAIVRMEEGMHWNDLGPLVTEETKKWNKLCGHKFENKRLQIRALSIVPYCGLVELSKNRTGYFDKQGIYHICNISDENIPLINRHCREWAGRGSDNYYYISDIDFRWNISDMILFGKAVRQLKEGDTWETFLSIAKNIQYQKNPDRRSKTQKWLDEIGMGEVIAGIEGPLFKRDSENKKTNTFDYIEVILYFLHRPNIKETIKTNHKKFTQIAAKQVSESKQFQAKGVPVNFLQLSDVRFNRNSYSLRFIYELKKEVQEILKNE